MNMGKLKFTFLTIMLFILLAASIQTIDGWHCHEEEEENICHKRDGAHLNE